MIFVNVDRDEWQRKNPELKVICCVCDYCGMKMESNLPFVTKGYVGLEAAPCSCGQNRSTCRSMVTSNDVEYQSWVKVLSYLEEI